jgi:hypothetical protein
VCDQEASKNEEAKARYRAVENTTTMGCNAKKKKKQTISTVNLPSPPTSVIIQVTPIIVTKNGKIHMFYHTA